MGQFQNVPGPSQDEFNAQTQAIANLETIKTGQYTINSNFDHNNNSTYDYVGKLGIFTINCSYAGATQTGWYTMATNISPVAVKETRCAIENITDSKPTLAKIENGTLYVYKPEVNKSYGGQIVFVI